MSNSNSDLTAKIRIDGDGTGATSAVDGVENSLTELEGVSQKVNAQLRAMAAAGQGVAIPAAGVESVGKLKVEATGAARSMNDLGNRANESTRDLLQAARAAEAIDVAFKTLGIRPLKDVRAETERLQAALATIKNAGIIGPDQERAVAAFKVKLAELRAEVAAIPGAATGAKTAIAGFGSEAKATESALGGLAGKAAAAVAALAGFNTITNVAGDVIKTGAAFETLEARLFSLLGSTEAAKEAMGNIKQLAISTPFEVSALADSFIKLTAFGLEPSMEQMRALSDTAATLGGGTEALTGVTLALGQAWAKGKLQGDEILQLAERGVPVWDRLAQATGKTTAELQKMSEAGELGRGTILKLIDAMGQMNAGASEKLMATFSGAVSNAKDALAEFYDMIAKAGVLDFLTGQLQDLLAEFDRMKQSGELQETAKKIADGFVAVGEGVRTAIEAVNALSGVIKLSIEVFAAWKLAGMTLIPVFGSVSKGAASLSVATEAATIALRAAGIQAQVTAAQTATVATSVNAAAVATGRLATALRLLKGLTLVGLIEGAVSLGVEFFRAKKEAEDSDRAIRKLMAPVQENGPKDAIKAVITETEAARFKLTEYQRALSEAQRQGKETGEALAGMVKKADISSVQGVSDLLNGLRSIEQGAMATGQQIQTAIQDRLNKLTAGELRDFGIMAQSAFNRGDISAQQLAATLNGQVDAALKGLGSSLEVSAGGMTAKFIEISQQIGVVEASYDRLKETGQDASAVLKAAFEGGLNTAKSVQDLEGLAVSIRHAGEAGRLSKREVVDFLDAIQAKVDAVTPGINSLAEAFKTLGMKSPDELKKAASLAEEAFNTIKNSADFTTVGINNTKEAFKRYAEAAIAANGGVASEMIKAQAWVYGYTVEVDKAGKALLTVADSAKEAMGGVAILGDAMQESANAAAAAASEYDGLSSAISRASNASQNAAQQRNAGVLGSVGRGSNDYISSGDSSGTLYDPRTEAIKAGATIDNVDEVTRLIQFEMERMIANNRGQLPNVREFDPLASSALHAVLAKSATKDSYSADTPGSDVARGAQPQKTIRVDLGSGPNRATVFAENDAAVKRLVSTLEQSRFRTS